MLRGGAIIAVAVENDLGCHPGAASLEWILLLQRALANFPDGLSCGHALVHAGGSIAIARHCRDDLSGGSAPRPNFEYEAMQFRLFYEGPLGSSQRRVANGQFDKKAPQKHAIRKVLHCQLEALWQQNPFLNSATVGHTMFGGDSPNVSPLANVIREAHPRCGYEFIPLVCREFDLLCKLDILVLRRDRPGGVVQGRDLDNRVKTLLDALRMPRHDSELAGDLPDQHGAPFFVLLQDDDLIDTISIETDDLLSVPSHGRLDDSFVRLLIRVTIRPYKVTMFNLGFA